MSDESNMTYARKFIIRCGFAKQFNGLWEVRKLFPHLQNVVAVYRIKFDELNPDDIRNNYKNFGFVTNHHCSTIYSVPGTIGLPDGLNDVSTLTLIEANTMLAITNCQGAKVISSE